MPNTIDNAISRLQVLSRAMTSVAIKSAPDYPIENADPCPFSLAYINNGTGFSLNASSLQINPIVNVDFLLNRANLKQAYQQSDAIILEYLQRLAGDPTLNGNVDTIQINREIPVRYETSVVPWNNVTLVLVRFTIQLKNLETPIAP